MLSQERERIREEEERKLEKAKQELETKLNLKEMQLQEMISKQNALEEKLNDVYKEVPEIKGENAHLIKERDTLQRYHCSNAPTEMKQFQSKFQIIAVLDDVNKFFKNFREVQRQKTLFKDIQDHMDELRQQTKEERKQRAKAAFKVSENIAKEREELVHQLHHLKDVNKNMMDRKVIFFTYCSYLEYVVLNIYQSTYFCIIIYF